MVYDDKNIMVSVCILTYNHVKYIQKTLNSIIGQEVKFIFEILIHDDASSDGTSEIIRQYETNYPGIIKPIYQKINKYSSEGGGMNIRYNFPRAKGKYIAMCEGDDYWTDPLKLQKQVDFLESNRDYVLCFHPCTFLIEKIDENFTVLNDQPLESIDYNYSVFNLLSRWNIPTASLVFRKTVDYFPEWFTEVASGDIALVMLLYEKGKFKLMKERMSVYRLSGNGVSQYHSGYRMIHYRAVLYSKLNEFYKYKYEKEIYDALDSIYNEFSDRSRPESKVSVSKRIFNKSKKFFK